MSGRAPYQAQSGLSGNTTQRATEVSPDLNQPKPLDLSALGDPLYVAGRNLAGAYAEDKQKMEAEQRRQSELVKAAQEKNDIVSSTTALADYLIETEKQDALVQESVRNGEVIDTDGNTHLYSDYGVQLRQSLSEKFASGLTPGAQERFKQSVASHEPAFYSQSIAFQTHNRVETFKANTTVALNKLDQLATAKGVAEIPTIYHQLFALFSPDNNPGVPVTMLSEVADNALNKIQLSAWRREIKQDPQSIKEKLTMALMGQAEDAAPEMRSLYATVDRLQGAQIDALMDEADRELTHQDELHDKEVRQTYAGMQSQNNYKIEDSVQSLLTTGKGLVTNAELSQQLAYLRENKSTLDPDGSEQAKIEKAITLQNLAYSTYQFLETNKNKPPAELLDMFDRQFKPRGGVANYAAKYASYTDIRSKLEGVVAKVQEDPGLMGASNSAYQQMVADGNIGGAIKLNLQTQAQQGVPGHRQAALPKQDLERMASSLNAMGVTEIDTWFTTMRNQLGDYADPETKETYFDRLMSGLTANGLSESKVIAATGVNIPAEYRQTVLKVDKAPLKDIESQLDSQTIKDVDSTVALRFKPYIQASVGPTPDGVRAAGRLTRVLTKLVKYHMVADGMDKNRAADTVLSKLYTDYYDRVKLPNQPREFLIPKGTNKQSVVEGMTKLLDKSNLTKKIPSVYRRDTVVTPAAPTVKKGSVGEKIKALVETEASKVGFDPNILARAAYRESGYNPNASNPSGASGLAQLMPDTYNGQAKALGLPLISEHYDPRKDPAIASRLMARMYSNFYKHGLQAGFNKVQSYKIAAAAYNAGPNSKEYQLYKSWLKAPDEKKLGQIRATAKGKEMLGYVNFVTEGTKWETGKNKELYNTSGFVNPRDAHSALLTRIKSQGVYVNTQKGLQVYLPDNDNRGTSLGLQPVRQSDGRPLVFTWDQIREAGKKPRAGFGTFGKGMFH